MEERRSPTNSVLEVAALSPQPHALQVWGWLLWLLQNQQNLTDLTSEAKSDATLQFLFSFFFSFPFGFLEETPSGAWRQLPDSMLRGYLFLMVFGRPCGSRMEPRPHIWKHMIPSVLSFHPGLVPWMAFSTFYFFLWIHLLPRYEKFTPAIQDPMPLSSAQVNLTPDVIMRDPSIDAAVFQWGPQISQNRDPWQQEGYTIKWWSLYL